MSVILLVAENLRRTRDSSLNYSTPSGKINVAISGVNLLTCTTIDLFFFSFSDTQACQLCPPEFWDNIWPGVKRLGCPFVDETNRATVPAGSRIVDGSRVMDVPTEFFFIRGHGNSPWFSCPLGLRRVPSGPERGVSDPSCGCIPPQSFSSFTVPACRGAPGGGSVWRAAQVVRDPRQAPPCHWEVQHKLEGTEGFCPLGMGAASAPLDETACASIPLRGKGVATSTHAPADQERAARTSTCHSRHARVARARLCGTVLCVGM